MEMQHDPQAISPPSTANAQGAAPPAAAQVAELLDRLRAQQLELETQQAELRRTQAALAESEARLNLAQEGADAGVWDWDLHTGAVYTTPQYNRLYGVEPNAIRNYDDWRQRILPADCARVEAERDAALAQQQPFDLEFRILRPDGAQRWISARGSGVYAADGSLVRVVGMNQDITARKETESALRASEARFRGQFVSTPVPTFLWQTAGEDFVLVDVNAAANRLARGTARRFVGMTAAQIYPDRPDLLEQFHTCLAQQSLIVYETPYRSRGDGKEGVVVFTFAYVSPELILLHAENVTAARLAEASLRRERAEMAALLENTDGSIWSVDANCRLLVGNSRFFEDTHRAYGRRLAVGDDLLALDGPPQALNYWRDCYSRALRGERFRVEIQRRFVDAGWSEYSFNPIRNSAGHILGVTVFGRDITERKAAEALIQEQLAEITFYYDNAPIGLAVLDADLRFVRVNYLLAAMNGLPAAGHIGRTVDEVVPALAAQVGQIREEILRTGAPITAVELRGETAAQPGVTRYWREGWYPLQDAAGAITGFHVIAEDVTAQRTAEAALRQSQQNLARAQQVGHLGSWEWDVPNQTLFWSDEMYRIFGVDRDFPLTFAAIEAAIHPDDRALNQARVQEALTVAAAVDFEFRIVRPDGAVRHVHQSIEIVRNEAAAEQRLFGIIQDITERKAATEAMKRSEANLHALLENTDDLIASRDHDGRLIAFNRSFARLVQQLFGVPAQVGLRTTDFHPPASRRHWEEVLARVYTGASYREDFAAEVAGETRYFELSLNPIWHEGAVIGSTEFTRDITARKQAEQERAQLQAQLAQAQKMETIGRLAGGVAHEFNNLLAVILMRTEMALQIAEPATPLHRNLTAIATAAQRSAGLVRQLLGFARRQVIRPQVLDLNAVVANLTPMLCKLAGEEIALNWRPGAELWSVKMDPSQVEQILTNLCLYARDAIAGAGVITFTTANVSGDQTPPGLAPADCVLLTVSNTGAGLPPDQIVHIFEPFFGLAQASKGAGLGLATVEGIVQQNRGQILATSAPDRGTTFSIYLPRAGTGRAQAPAAVSLPTVLAQGNGETVLLVEDEETLLHMGVEALEFLGYRVLAAATPAVALALATAHPGPIDLLVTDVIMPEMNGRDLAEQVAALRPGVKRLFVSGYPAEFVAQHGVLTTEVHFLHKPFTLPALADKVREALGAA